MRTQDKNNLIISCVLLGIILVIAGIWAGTRNLPFIGIAGITLAIEIIYCMPSVCKKYYNWCDADCNIYFIPYVNIIQCFSSVISVLSIIFTILGILGIFFLKLPSGILKLFGENFIIDYGDSVFYYGILMLLIVSVLWGIGYAKIYREVKYEIDSRGVINNVSDFLFMLTLFIPAIRVIGLMCLNTNLDAALNMTDSEDEDEFDEVEYDE